MNEIDESVSPPPPELGPSRVCEVVSLLSVPRRRVSRRKAAHLMVARKQRVDEIRKGLGMENTPQRHDSNGLFPPTRFYLILWDQSPYDL